MDQRKKKIYTILLIGSGVTLFVNYVLFPAENPSRLVQVGATSVSLQTTNSTKTTIKFDAIPELVFPRELPSWPPEGRNHDIFAAPFETVAGKQISIAANSGLNTLNGTKRSGKKVFADKHTLQIVMDDKQRPIAVVDDEWLNLGDEFDQCKLLSVKGATALFECYDGEVLLELETSSAK